MAAVPTWLWWIVAAVSLLTFLLTVLDKARARIHARRIRERTLLVAALLGGSPGLFLGMVLAHHKTSKASFVTSLVAVVALQAVAVLAWLILV